MTDRPRSLDRRLRRVADTAGFTVLWGWILLSMLFVPTWFGYWWLGVVLFFVGFVVCWQAADATTHPVTTIGRRQEVTKTRVTDDCPCDECHEVATGGERRRYATRHVLFGTTVAVPDWGENVYCPDCLEREAHGVDLRPSREDVDGTATAARSGSPSGSTRRPPSTTADTGSARHSRSASETEPSDLETDTG